MNISEADLITHPYWVKLFTELIEQLQQIYKSSLPLPKALRDGYVENDPLRSMSQTIQEYIICLGNNWICNSCHETVVASIKGVDDSLLLSLSWTWTIVYRHAQVTGYSTEGHSWAIGYGGYIDTGRLALLPLVLEAVKVYATEGLTTVKERELDKQNYLDAVADLATQML